MCTAIAGADKRLPYTCLYGLYTHTSSNSSNVKFGVEKNSKVYIRVDDRYYVYIIHAVAER